MRRWISSLLVVLIALGGLIQHAEMALAADMPGHHMSAEMIAADTQHYDKEHPPSQSAMTDACAIICLGTSTPWIVTAHLAPVRNEHHLQWPFTDAAHDSRGVGPAVRPPKSL